MFTPLNKCRTFNDIGLDALKAVGRAGLWSDEEGLQKFIRESNHSVMFPCSKSSAQSQVQSEAITERPCKWYFVELLEGEFEDSDPELMADPPGSMPLPPPRMGSSEKCPHTGWWFSPAHHNSRRYFREGAIFPKFESDYGYTFWIWSPDQSIPSLLR